MSHHELLRDQVRMTEEAKSGYRNVGYMKFLFEAYDSKFFFFEVVECVRRLLLACIVGLIKDNSPANALVGVIICLFFNQIFNLKPFNRSADNNLGMNLSISLTLLFLAALLQFVDLSSNGANARKIWTVCLFIILFGGPIMTILQMLMALADSISKVLSKAKKPDQTNMTNQEMHNKQSHNLVGEGNPMAMLRASGMVVGPRKDRSVFEL